MENLNIFKSTPILFRSLLLEEQEAYIEAAFNHYRTNGFPRLVLSVEKLKKIIYKIGNWDTKATDGILDHCTIGVNFCEHFFPHIYEASRYDAPAPIETFLDDNKFKKFLRNRFTYPPIFSDAAFRRGFKLNRSVCNFKPTAAKFIYTEYLPDQGTVYDFSAGYGGRLLGFLSADKAGTYIGVDPFKKTCISLRNMYDFWQNNVDKSSTVQIHEACAEDFYLEDSSIDLAFSSPPYFDLERYSNDDTQSYKRYSGYTTWLESFWRIIVNKCFKALKPDGRLVYVVGNYSRYDLIGDFNRICMEQGFIKEKEFFIPLANMFMKKATKQNFKYETAFVFKKEKF